ncbi:MAG: hypothetical protein PWP27_2199 [Clostridiales bacterium]|jgi:NAD(P)-dependent dehydrogenase (short-subunit alcohol dehydrogenase family)|nr:hypothetical protein [Clostridiales bacterium]MDK2934389.1 hypothetical protein [Clostridiales bacterium]
MFDLSEKKAIITGVSGGLERGIVKGLHEASAEVVAIIDVSEKMFSADVEIG